MFLQFEEVEKTINSNSLSSIQFHLFALITPGFHEINLALFRSELLEVEAAIAKLDSESGGQELPDLEKEIDELEQERKLAEDEVDRVSIFDPFSEKC